MRLVVQRVADAAVKVDGDIVGQIGLGLLIFVGIGKADTEKDVEYLANKTVELRIFEDTHGKQNLSLLDINGKALIVSQFTLYGDIRRGRRPSYDDAADPLLAEPLYKSFVERMRQRGVRVETGRFRTMMQVTSTNIGPVTLICESDKLKEK